MKLEILSQKAAGGATKAPMLFVHGSYHAAWCWTVHFFDYFSARGHDCYAVSLRGQGGSDVPSGVAVAGTLEEHAADVKDACAFVSKASGAPPILVGHSFGGLVCQRLFTGEPPPLSGLALLASVPPSGNGEMVKRFIKRSFIASMKITYAFIAGAFKTNEKLCRECFFSDDLPDAELKTHMGSIATSCRVRLLDLKALNDSLPIPRPIPGSPPVCVIGGENDFVVDVEGVAECAEWGGVDPVVLPRSAHDLMLDTRWEACAQALAKFATRVGRKGE